MSKVTRPIVIAGFLAGLGLLAVWYWRHTDDPTSANPDMSGWGVVQVAEHLRCQGLNFRLIPGDDLGANTARNAYLTTTAKTWRELNVLLKVRERIGDWEGTLHCELVNRPGACDLQIELWGDCCLAVGPFVFFGDRELLAQVRIALQPAGS